MGIKKGVTPGNSSEKSTETKPSQQSSSSSPSTTKQQKQKLVLPKDEALRNEAALNHRFAKYMSYRDPNDRHLKVSRLVFERHKGKVGMAIGGGCVIAATVAEQLENFETMKHNLPMKLDGRSLVI